MASIPRSSAVRRCVPTLPRYLHPHLTLPAKGLSRAPGYEYQDALRTVVAIEILPEGATNCSPRPSPSAAPTSSPLSSTFPASTFRQSQPRPISVIDPTVTFTSRSSMVAHSFFTVLRDGQIVHNETAEVNLHSTSVEAGPSDIDCTFYCTAPLVPGFWATICQDPREFSLLCGMGEFAGARILKCLFVQPTRYFFPDPPRYSIIHDIYQHSGPAAEESNFPEQGLLILSVEYRFTYPESPYSSPQLSHIDSLSNNNSSLPSPSSFSGVSTLLYLPYR